VRVKAKVQRARLDRGPVPVADQAVRQPRDELSCFEVKPSRSRVPATTKALSGPLLLVYE
jgi:hypothetical protein